MTLKPLPAGNAPDASNPALGHLGAEQALALLLRSPAPMVLVGERLELHWANAAALRLIGTLGEADLGVPLPRVLALDEADAALLHRGIASGAQYLTVRPRRGAPAPQWLRISPSALPGGGALLALDAADAMQAATERAERLAELLEVAQDFGRLGVWERNLRTMQGRWDQHVYRFWGLDPTQPAPSFDVAAQNVVEADRQASSEAFHRSMARAGTYSQRFRVRAADGTLRHLHEQWTVVDGPDGRPERALGVLMDDTDVWSLSQSHATAVEQLALAVDLGNIAIWRHDLATDRMLYNAQAWHVLGLQPRPEGFTLDEVRKLIHPDDLPKVVQSAAMALQTDAPVDTDVRYRRSDGSWRNVMLRRTVQRDATGRPMAFIGMAIDVTARVEEAQRNDELRRRFDLVTHSAGIGYWSLQGGSERGEWSESLRALHGLAEGEPVPTRAQWLKRFVHPDDRQEVRRRLHHWARSGEDISEGRLRIVTAGGQVRELFTRSRVEARSPRPTLFGVVIDVTEQRSAELALREASERAALAARGAGLGTWEIDQVSNLAIWDEQMWRLRGREPRDKAPDFEERLAMVHPDDRAAAQRLSSQAETAVQAMDYEFRVVWPDGRVRWLASRSTSLLDAQGRVVRRIGLNWDVTDTRTADAVRQEREIALRESQAKSRFLSRMSHELRTPLNAVIGFAQLLLADEPGTDDASASRRRRLDHIRGAGQHLLSLINDVLDLSSLDSGEVPIALQPVPLAPVVAELLPLLEPLQREREVRVAGGALQVSVMADPTRLRQVLLNLLTNAVKYNAAGGLVRIEALPLDDAVAIRVSDTGRGLTEQQMRHLFEPFNRLGIEGEGIEGTGIGLAIVKTLVERMGGAVHVISQPGRGSVFEIRLAPGPAPHEAPPPPAVAPTAPQPSRSTRARLLYIEDNPVNALIVSELVARRPDLALQVAADGTEGVAHALSQQPDLILLDMQLPDIDGYEVMRRLRADPRTALVPVIALSANAMPADIERALRAGMSDYWTKPLDFRVFMASLEALFGPAPAA